ncbi:histone H1-delta-like [Saccostrea echinata]|uniref:histone H1-delta-like n=1 Tax=Saccostrea echinata TaxID=191078 RepID=UPI002A816103|nr:histone H1-delta-like [Saccostrea echinata]
MSETAAAEPETVDPKPETEKVGKATKAAKSPKKKSVKSKNKTPLNHPHYREMIKDALTNLKERGGSSRQAILKYIMKNFKVDDEKSANNHLKMALRAGVKNGSLKQSKGTGASGSFRLGEGAKSHSKPKPKKEKTTKPKTEKKVKKKPKVKAKAEKKPKEKTEKKTKSPKKAAKKAAKPKKKSPKKAAAKK